MNRNKRTLFCCLKIKSAGLLVGLIDLFLNLMLLLALCTAFARPPSMYNYYVKQLASTPPKEGYLYNPSQDSSEQQPHSLFKIMPIGNSHSSSPAIESAELIENDASFANNLNIFNNKRKFSYLSIFILSIYSLTCIM